MVKYNSVYSFQVQSMIEEGKTVYMLDRERHAVFCVNDLSVYEFITVLKADSGEHCSRFDFWYEKEVEADGTV